MPSHPAQLGRPKVISEEVREKIRQCYRDHYGQWGPRTVACWCRRQGLGTWCASTVAAVIADLRDEPEDKPEPIRYEITAPQVMWSEDGTGFKEKGRKRELLIAQDEHARFKVNRRLVDGPAREQDVVSYLEEAFQRYGPPLVIKHDGDAIFHGDRMRELLDRYEVIELTGPRAYPQYKGYVSYYTPSVRSDMTFGNRLLSLSFRPWLFAGASGPGGSYKNSFLSL